MTVYRNFHGSVVAEIGDRLIDPVLLAFARHHASTPGEIDAVLDFVSCASVNMRQLGILLDNLGTNERPLMTSLEVSAYDAARTMICTMHFEESEMTWRGGVLSMDRDAPPASLMAALVGGPLHRFIEHPYLPRDMVIDAMSQNGEGWRLTLRATHQGPSRTRMVRI